MRLACLSLVAAAGLLLIPALATAAEPTAEARYGFVFGRVCNGKTAVVAVGCPCPADAAAGESFPAGFMGLADGVYDCYPLAGKPVMARRTAAACPCGIGCACARGVCPTGCPTAAAPVAYPSFQLGGCPGGACANGQCQPAPRGLFFRR